MASRRKGGREEGEGIDAGNRNLTEGGEEKVITGGGKKLEFAGMRKDTILADEKIQSPNYDGDDSVVEPSANSPLPPPPSPPPPPTPPPPPQRDLASIFGLFNFIVGVGIVVIPIASGAVVDTFVSFKSTFIFHGCGQLIVAVLMATACWLSRRDAS